MFKQRSLLIGCSAVVLLLATLMTFAQNKGPVTEQERTVKEAEVPKPALEALKRLADKAAITEFAEEIEHGHRFYEGSWTGPAGNVDALVTDTGDLVEIEEIIPADKVPPAVRAKSEKQAGKDAKVTFEKKTLLLYEIHYQKDGKSHEAIFTPDGRAYREEGEKKRKKKDDEDDD